MILNKFSKWLNEDCNSSLLLVVPFIVIIISWGFFVIDYLVPVLIATMGLAEWAYISGLRNTKQKKIDKIDMVFMKLGYMLLSLPFAMIGSFLLKYHLNILSYFKVLLTGIVNQAVYILIGIVIFLGIYL